MGAAVVQQVEQVVHLTEGQWFDPQWMGECDNVTSVVKLFEW